MKPGSAWVHAVGPQDARIEPRSASATLKSPVRPHGCCALQGEVAHGHVVPHVEVAGEGEERVDECGGLRSPGVRDLRVWRDAREGEGRTLLSSKKKWPTQAKASVESATRRQRGAGQARPRPCRRYAHPMMGTPSAMVQRRVMRYDSVTAVRSMPAPSNAPCGTSNVSGKSTMLRAAGGARTGRYKEPRGFTEPGRARIRRHGGARPRERGICRAPDAGGGGACEEQTRVGQHDQRDEGGAHKVKPLARLVRVLLRRATGERGACASRT